MKLCSVCSQGKRCLEDQIILMKGSNSQRWKKKMHPPWLWTLMNPALNMKKVSFRDTSRMGPKPIVFKFIRRLARNEVMSKRKEGRSVDPSTIGLHKGTDMSNVLLLGHLTPRLQQLYSDAKEFKLKYGYQFC